MNQKPFLVFLTCLLANSAYSGTMGPSACEWQAVSTLSLGASWQDAGDSQTFFLAPDIEKSYVARRSSQALFDAEVFMGLEKELLPHSLGQLGLAVAATSDAKLSGVIWDDADPLFENFTYSYRVRHTHLALKGKLIRDFGFWASPWLSASLGVGFNRSHSFVNTPLIFEALPNPNFASHTETSFTYTLGAGLQKALNEHWQLGLGYEFADWGKSHLNAAAGQTLGQGLSLDHLYTNGIFFTLSCTV